MRTDKLLSIMKVLAWVIFIGLCIRTGTILVLSIYSMLSGQELQQSIYEGFYISGLYEQNLTSYLLILLSVIVAEVLKTYMFFLVTKLFKSINLDQPFSKTLSQLITSISYVALAIGVFSFFGNAFMQWYRSQGVVFSYEWVSTEFIFLAGILFIIGAIFKRGLDLQSETDLTV